jgi:DNA-binding winged helix-turn-helix (wHTH) protein/Flp pilus assembly protein TadD
VSVPSFRFGPFFADGTGYRVLRENTSLDLTPKLLDLLFFLLEHAGELVTKEQLLDALWPGANVTENALAQAMSELREAIGDDAGSPRFIKTVARRGYRFIAPVERIEPGRADQPDVSGRPAHNDAIAVLDFTNVTGDPESAWLSAGIAETVSADLRALGCFHVLDRRRVVEGMRRTDGSLQQMAADLGVALVAVGSFQRLGDRIRITGRIVDVAKGDALADAKVDGPVAGIFELQDQVVAQFAADLGVATGVHRRAVARDTASVEAYRAATEGWLRLETLDVREIPRAIEHFERAIAVDRRYALAYTGLANAEIVAYESTRSDNAPAHDLLASAIGHARTAVSLDDRLAEAHATLAFVLVSAWETDEAIRTARRAIALDPDNWRHVFRLGHASWGEERLRAAARTLTLYPDFAFAHFQIAMVHVARGDLAEAETVLRHGAAVQDRQIGRGERYPALGLHWLLALVRLAGDDIEEAIGELDRERELAQPHRLYGREYAMSVQSARGACLLRLERFDEAVDAYHQALALYPDHAQSNFGLALAFASRGAHEAAASARRKAESALDVLASARPFEAAMVSAQILVADGGVREAKRTLVAALERAPRGFALWTIPVEPCFRQVIDSQSFAEVIDALSNRAR